MTEEDIAFEINNTDNKMIFLAGVFDEFQMHNFAVNNNYSHVAFELFLVENKITKEMFENKANENKILISIDRWTQQIAYKEQKGTVIIDDFTPSKIESYLIRSLFMQDLIYLSKNNQKLVTNVVFVVDMKHGALEEQVMPKILENSKIINVDVE
ncbi:MAG: hypothetical protein ACTSO7_06640 [Candidatus Heimdallarchaeota archaeon]